MAKAIIMVHINITNFVLISQLEKYHSMIQKRRLKNVFFYIQKLLHWIIDFMLKGKSLLDYTNFFSPNDYEKNDKVKLKYFQ